jgi:tetratricopeptide (TPR) repeat protein
MGFLDFFRPQKGLFAKLTENEKRSALELDDFYLQSILDARSGKAKVVEIGTDSTFVEKMTDHDIKEAIDLVRLQKKAVAASERGNHREAIQCFESILVKAPFDSISMMSIGVQYAHLRDGRTAVQYLERALKSDPSNQRIRGNLQAVREDFGL